jgi:hypothetical protein
MKSFLVTGGYRPKAEVQDIQYHHFSDWLRSFQINALINVVRTSYTS